MLILQAIGLDLLVVSWYHRSAGEFTACPALHLTLCSLHAMATLADIVADCTPELEWRDSSRWATPHPNDFYTSEIKGYHSAELTEYLSFHVSGMQLILCKKTCHFDGTVETLYYNMGEFTEPIVSCLSQLKDTAERIKEYAAYVVESYRKHCDFRSCPSFELIDDVDENFNPIY